MEFLPCSTARSSQSHSWGDPGGSFGLDVCQSNKFLRQPVCQGWGQKWKLTTPTRGNILPQKHSLGILGGLHVPGVSHIQTFILFILFPQGRCVRNIPALIPLWMWHLLLPPGTFKNTFMGDFQLIPRSFYKNGARFLRNNVAESQEPWFASLGQVPVTTGPWFGGTGQCLVYGCTQWPPKVFSNPNYAVMPWIASGCARALWNLIAHQALGLRAVSSWRHKQFLIC